MTDTTSTNIHTKAIIRLVLSIIHATSTETAQSISAFRKLCRHLLRILKGRVIPEITSSPERA
jgi:hypothetical protein